MIDRLGRFPVAIAAAVEIAHGADAGWSPDPGSWSIAQIVQHLLDEERDDFRARLTLLLRDPKLDWPPLDPEGTARARGNRPEQCAALLREFAHERGESVAWLRGLLHPGAPAVDWSLERRHPVLGAMRAGDLLAAWAAHDALHLRQVAKRLHQLAARDAGAFSVGYAGPWRA